MPSLEGFGGNGSLAGDDLEVVRKAHWAIEKVSEDMRRFAFNTAIAAVMELLNDCSRLRDSANVEALRFALASAASLLFPFALSGIGVLVIAAGLYYHKHQDEIAAWLERYLPEVVLFLRPPDER